MIHVAVDAGAMHAGDGIARYVEQTIAAIDRQARGAVRWSLYGRGPVHDFGARLQVARSRSDHLPAQAGRTLGMFLSLPWWTARDRPDVFWGPAHRLPWAMPRRTALVVTVHDLCWKYQPHTMRPLTRWLDAGLMPRALRRADRILASSSATRRDLTRLFPQHARRISVAYPAPATLPRVDASACISRLGLSAPFALFVGTPEPRKNLDRLLDAFASVRQHAPALQLVVVGARGWGEESPEQMILRHGLDATVRYLGRVSDADLAALYQGARMLVMPSCYEGFGLPLVEAMGFGTPVVTSKVASMPEVAGDAALLVDPGDSRSIAAAILRLARDETLHSKLSIRARAQAARFTDAASARAMLYAFERALQSRRR
jgi:glycosyltransferase involved in cell wall biosynthesis